MKFVIQRVKEAKVEVEGKTVGQIGEGFMVLIGICQEDTKEIADKLIKKMVGLRIFQDNEGKTNLNLEAVKGSLLLVSQFTLYADCKKGYRPSFINSGSPEHAEELYEYIIKECRKKFEEIRAAHKIPKLQISKESTEGFVSGEDAPAGSCCPPPAGSISEMKVETGIFGADMKVSLLNDGPFTIILDSREL